MQQQRNYGIDLLRMFSMLLVVILHTEGHGGVLEAAQGHSVYWALPAGSICLLCGELLCTDFRLCGSGKPLAPPPI